jgi:predicted nucleic acid-binding protein
LPPLAPEPTSAAALRVVVSDAGPLISLGRLDLLRLLPILFAQVQVPDQVLRECLQRPSNADTARIASAMELGWLTSCGAPVMAEGTLGRGERAAISQALAIGAGVLTDDQEARLHAQSLHLAVIGTFGRADTGQARWPPGCRRTGGCHPAGQWAALRQRCGPDDTGCGGRSTRLNSILLPQHHKHSPVRWAVLRLR